MSAFSQAANAYVNRSALTDIRGSQTNISGGVHIQTQYHSINPASRDAPSEVSGGERAERASDVYARILLTKRIGYPLWIPEPSDYFPEYEREGVGIGDVGLITFDGHFDFLFNIYLPNGHTNNHLAPPAFVPLPGIRPIDVITRRDIHSPGCVIASKSVKREVFSSDGELYNNRYGFHFTCGFRDGALLVLPDGATRTDLRFRRVVFEYALQHVTSWYEHVNCTLGLNAPNGSLYLVTGADKSSNWCVASYSDSSGDAGIALRFTAADDAIGATVSAMGRYSWASSGSVEARTCSAPVEGSSMNQCVFVRGYKLALSDSLYERSFVGPVKVSDIISSNPSDILARGGSIPGQTTTTAWFSWLVGRHSRSGPTEPMQPTSSGAGVSVADFPKVPEAYHPSTTVIRHLFDSIPGADIAITHDDDWCAVIKEDDTSIPDDPELLGRIVKHYCPARDAGCIYLAPKVSTKPPEAQDVHQSSQSLPKSTTMTLPYVCTLFSDRRPRRCSMGMGGKQRLDAEGRPPWKKALLVGIGYRDEFSPYDELVGAPRDVRAMRLILIEMFDYDPKDIVVMLESSKNPDLIPTRANILTQVDKLVIYAREGDQFYFHYAGHSTQLKDRNDPDDHDLGEAIVPIDDNNYEKVITDSDLRRHLVDAIPIGTRLFAIFDTSHSASPLDLPHINCNRVYVPWISKGVRRTDLVFSKNVRRNAGLRSVTMGDNLHLDPITFPSKVAPRASTRAFPRGGIRRVPLPSKAESGTFSPFYSDTPTSPIQRTRSPEPIDPEDGCHGFCKHTLDEMPYVIALSASADFQQAWDDERGRGMTYLLVEILKENRHRSLKEVLTELNHRNHSKRMRLHATAQEMKRRRRGQANAPYGLSRGTFWDETYTDDLEASSPTSDTVTDTEGTSIVPGAGPDDTGDLQLEMHNFQNPQLSSNRRLDMDAPFML